VVHNHPTGQLTPSSADRKITNALLAAAETLELRFLDHIIVGREGKGYFSFRENGLI
jgi:DNA repair protein RadC